MSRIKARVQGTLVPGERADQGRSALDFRVEQDSETKEGEPRTCQRRRIAERSKDFFSIFLDTP